MTCGPIDDIGVMNIGVTSRGREEFAWGHALIDDAKSAGVSPQDGEPGDERAMARRKGQRRKRRGKPMQALGYVPSSAARRLALGEIGADGAFGADSLHRRPTRLLPVRTSTSFAASRTCWTQKSHYGLPLIQATKGPKAAPGLAHDRQQLGSMGYNHYGRPLGINRSPSPAHLRSAGSGGANGFADDAIIGPCAGRLHGPARCWWTWA